MELLQKRKENWSGRKLAMQKKKKIGRIKEENPIADETLAGLGSSIHVQPDELRRQVRGLKEKNPAVAAAGR